MRYINNFGGFMFNWLLKVNIWYDNLTEPKRFLMFLGCVGGSSFIARIFFGELFMYAVLFFWAIIRILYFYKVLSK